MDKYDFILRPIKDMSKNWEIDIANVLEDYLEEILNSNVVFSFDNGETKLNFAEASYLIQGTVCCWSKKVDYYHELVYQMLDFINSRQHGGEDGNDLEQENSNKRKGAQSRKRKHDDDNNFLLDLFDLEAPNTFTPTSENHSDSVNYRSKPLGVFDSVGDRGTVIYHPKGDVHHYFDYWSNKTIPLEDDGTALPYHLYGACIDAGSKPLSSADDVNFIPQTAADIHIPSENVLPADESYDAGGCSDMSFADLPAEAESVVEPPRDRTITANVEEFVIPNAHDVETGQVMVPIDNIGSLTADDFSDDEEFPDAFEIIDKYDENVTAGVKRVVPEKRDYLIRCNTRRKKLAENEMQSQAAMLEESIISQTKITTASSKMAPKDKVLTTLINCQPVEQQQSLPEENDGEANFDPTGNGATDDDVFNSAPGSVLETDKLQELCSVNDDNFDVFEDDEDGCDEAALFEAAGSMSYEDMVKLHVDKFYHSVKSFKAQNARQKRVSEWDDYISPKLAVQDERPEFDIHKYGDEMLSSFSNVGEKNSFANICGGSEKWVICRRFASTLQLVNDGNFELVVERTPRGNIVNSMDLVLLKQNKLRERFNEM